MVFVFVVFVECGGWLSHVNVVVSSMDSVCYSLLQFLDVNQQRVSVRVVEEHYKHPTTLCIRLHSQTEGMT